MNENSVVTACPSCGRSNRVPLRHLAHTGRCGACKTRLMDNVGHMDVYHGEHFDAVKCPKCGKYNGLPQDDHHHH